MFVVGRALVQSFDNVLSPTCVADQISKKYKPTKSASTTAVMPDALMTELTPMEHSQNIVGSCSFRVLGRTFTQQRARQTTWQHRAKTALPTKKKGTAVSRQRPSDYCN
mgnify:CR=1 FL=1